MNPIAPRLAAAALAALVAPALAQTAPEVLQRASTAIDAAQRGRATVAMDVIATGRLAQAMPDGTAVFTWRRDDQGVEEDTAVWRITGEVRNRKDGDPRAIDVRSDAQAVTYVDDVRRRVVTLTPGRKDAVVSLTDRIVIDEFFDDRPLIDSFEGAELALEGTATHAGELCDVLVITHPAGEGADKPEYLSEKWMIARSDAFPRRIERTADLSMFGTILIALDLTDVTLGDALPEGALELDVPEGFTQPGARTATIGAPATAEPAGESAPAEREVAPVSRHPAAPAYTFTDVDGTTYTNDSQRGRVTVLYYWGTWCVPCREFSPLVSALAETFEGQPVDVLAPAIRERNENAPRELLAENGYRHTLVLGAEDTVRPFSVRVYPTVIVIGPDQTIREVGRPSRERDAGQVMAEIEKAVREALAG